jgi:hypothetical protein
MTNIKYKIGQIVFLKTDAEQLCRMVTGILIRDNYCVYYLTNCTFETSHYEMEISEEINEIIKLISN